MPQGPYIVTGASKGIGRAIAHEIAKQGYPVLALARASPELEQIGTELILLHPESMALACDLSGTRYCRCSKSNHRPISMDRRYSP